MRPSTVLAAHTPRGDFSRDLWKAVPLMCGGCDEFRLSCFLRENGPFLCSHSL